MEKEHRKSTLMNYSKERLVEYCMCLEHNNNVMENNFNQQYKNCMQMLDDMKLINNTYKNRQKECPDKEYEWVPMGDGNDVPFMCSKCCKTWKFYKQRTSRHCPNCGAPMKARRTE